MNDNDNLTILLADGTVFNMKNNAICCPTIILLPYASKFLPIITFKNIYINTFVANLTKMHRIFSRKSSDLENVNLENFGVSNEKSI